MSASAATTVAVNRMAACGRQRGEGSDPVGVSSMIKFMATGIG